MQFLTDPIPHAEAVKLIADKPAVSREIFDQLAQEFKGRAMTITGIEDFDIMQSVQDKLATLPAGADWKKLRKEIATQISPWLGEEEGLRRAKLLLNHHGRAAYAATNARVIHAQDDVFTHLMYRSSRTSKEPRGSHRALDGMIFPTKHPFWATHTPPWEFGCNCMDPIPLTQEDLEDQDPAKIADAAQLAALEGGNFVSGNNIFNIQTPRQKSGGAAGYEWSWEDTTLPYEEIRKRWTQDVAEKFEKWADGIPMDGDTTLLAHLTGLAAGGGKMETYRAPSFAAALSHLGLEAKDAWSRKDVADLRAAMRKPDAIKAYAAIESIEGAKASGTLTRPAIRRGVQDLLDLLPPEIAATLPPLKIRIVPRLTVNGKVTNEAARYRTGGRLLIAAAALKGLKGNARDQELRRLLAHELMHWTHMDAEGAAADAYRAAIRSHYQSRTAGNALETAKEGYLFRRDGWWDTYAGAEYDFEKGDANGMEIPTKHFELWEEPERLILESDLTNPSGRGFRETFALVNSIFNNTP